jgi:hypothetical protein
MANNKSSLGLEGPKSTFRDVIEAGRALTRNVIYVAGPDFTSAERLQLEGISSVFESVGLFTYLAHRDGLECVTETTAGKCPSEDHSRLVFLACLCLETFQVTSRCGCLVYDISGRVPDEECAFKAGMAFACGRHVVLFKPDIRTVFNGRDNPMITRLQRSGKPAANVEEAVNRTIEALDGEPETPEASKIHEMAIGKYAAAGGIIWEEMKRHRSAGNSTGLVDAHRLVCEGKLREMLLPLRGNNYSPNA